LSDRPLKVLLISGNENHKWHNWEENTPLIREALQAEGDIEATVALDIEVLAEDLSEFDVLAFNYCNWHDPKEPSETAKTNVIAFGEQGKGIVVLHFANGAFHFSLPEAEASDWPEYRRIVPRAWDHHGGSAHDDYGTFTVRILDEAHPITQGIPAFETQDELYFDQRGEVEIHPLYAAVSKITNREEPLAWTSAYRNSRVYQTLLGHDRHGYAAAEVRETLRRAVRWVARRL